MTTTTRRHPHVVNIDEVETWKPPVPGPPPFAATAKWVGAAAGSKKLGARLFEVPAGHTAMPCHAHHNNEEALFILEGRGTVRIGSERVPVRAGDWVAHLAGPEHAHQLWADAGEPIRYLAISTMNDVDVVTYPDSGKLLTAMGLPPTGIRKIFHVADGNKGYWDGEGQATEDRDGQ